MSTPTTRFSLRDLPLPAKLVVTVFLLSVGLGYVSAMVQLHFKHAAKGEVLPTTDDLVARFSGKLPPWKPAPEPVEPKKKVIKFKDAKVKTIFTERCITCHSKDGGEDPKFDKWDAMLEFLPKPGDKGKMHKLITAPTDSPWGKDSSMRSAFTTKSEINGKKWERVVVDMKPEEVAKLEAEREMERKTLIAWLEAGAKKEEFDADAFSGDFTTDENEDAIDPVEKAKRRQIDVESLTQSTHAHLLSFSMLWALTGLVFAFTSYPMWIRLGIAPVVLIAQVADVLCWWLARLPNSGPYFAVAIMGTGAIVAMGLGAQIVLSLFNMYDKKGKAMILLMFLGAGVIAGILAPKVMDEVKKEKPAVVAPAAGAAAAAPPVAGK